MISWTQVTELRDDVGHDDFGEVVEIFLEEVEEHLSTLAQGPGLEEVLHALKGSALNLGFDRFAALCSEGERAAAAGEDVDVAEIQRVYAASRDVFLAELEERLAA